MSIVYHIIRFCYSLRATKWKIFFKPNGVRTWVDLRFTGFRELQDDLAVAAQWVGMTNTGDHYYTSVTIDCSGEWRFASERYKSNWMFAKQREAEARIQSYIDPLCHCRLGFHWKCPLHYRWVD